MLSEVSYGYVNGTVTTWASALNTTQWDELFAYQTTFGVRMVRLDVFPTSDFGTTTAVSGAGCCNTGVEQLLYFSNTTAFSTANLKTGIAAGVSTEGLWHYPATITNSSIATEIAQFGPSADGTFATTSTAAVINNIGGRQQMVWFTSYGTDWSPASNFVMHGHIHWLTRGLFVGRRRIYFNTQVDDMHLETDLYLPNGTTFRVVPADVAWHVTWMANLNSRLPAGSNYTMEIGHNGNGAIEEAIYNQGGAGCVTTDAIEYADQIDTALEFQKPIGTGTDIWPTTPAPYVNTYSWTLACVQLDALAKWFSNPTNANAFSHITHTFTHEGLDNATLADATKEIVFNVAWLKQVGLYNAEKFSPNGLIPPAITGLHNGDAINAWMTNGIVNVVGDNTRPVLMNTVNEFWPLISTVASNGYAGLTIMPRWATTIFYNCDTPACTLAEWIATSAGSGNFSYNLLNDARATNTRHLLGLHHDAFMFHQANLRQSDINSTTTIGDQTGQFSLIATWVETVMQEFIRLVTWPVLSITHDHSAQQFLNRMALDQCNPNLNYIYGDNGTTITSVTVTATGNTCSVPIPVTFPGQATTNGTATSEQIGTDALTMWATLSGSPVTFTLNPPVTV